ncbi:zinc ribbon domain-containing protein [Piscinibacter sp.]|jgi:putative FmdB family regulatory protein|uniref:FmdB family zinc ribbon protein n=1 Tax=Piscinibacter sp. TaxID=1903157 RepID=UPI001B594212|nr:zinc ribbon domain-containing protein [Piscinibacter sp.]MBK7533594.1 zinc ribbon domain-containing protein [Piscinibacter sp.]MBL0092589.1 zinc ribbon domain-containing protein [Piscinibacter sp.]MBP6541008.1 zinc ribbon domain-containing protein [Piscinibacter sp.]HOY35273.1 zinc ribbon domain-containing protein [Piscinibacter sp.]
MPLYDYRCNACGQQFELLVRSSTVPACPHCAATALERLVSLTAPQGTSQALIAAGRRAAAKQGHFSHYSKAERAKVSK